MGAACSKTDDPSQALNNPANFKMGKAKNVTFAEPITQMEPVVTKSPVKEVKRKDSSSSSSSDEDKKKKHQKEEKHETPAPVIQISQTPIAHELVVEQVHLEDVSIKLLAA